ncbi:MAG: hypothetical protein ACI4FZ_03145 [Lachnospiraceae bacterium]
MEIVAIIAAGMLVLAIKGIYDRKNAKLRLYQRLKDEWGTLPKEEYTEEKYHSIQYYYEKKYQSEQSDRFFLDKITWNDLNMDEIFMTINATCSSMGEEYLNAILHELLFDLKELEERERVIAWFAEHEEDRLQLQMALSAIGKHKKISIYEYMDRISDVRQESNIKHFIGLAGILFGLLLLPFSTTIGGALLVCFICSNILTYYKRKGEIEPYLAAMSYTIRLLDNAEKIASFKLPELAAYTGPMAEKTTHFRSFRRGAGVVTPQNATGDMMSLFLDYFRILFHTDLIKFNNMLCEFLNKKAELIEIFETVGFLDAMCAVASFRVFMGVTCIPELHNDGKKELWAEELYHPFVEHPVPASLKTDRSILLTGSNASGKSTFLKAVAINAILAQTVHTALCKRYIASCFQVMTSIALTDNLFEKESYYIVEIKSLKRILDAAQADRPTLCFVDEVLRGTNTVERIAASSRVLISLANSNAVCFAATHDIELTHLLEEYYTNYHFEEQIKDGQVVFDYQLKEGRATTQNAIQLLGMMGYPDELISAARKTARHFTETGEWAL